MTITIPVIDWNDPCGALAILRPIWLQASLDTTTGAGVTRVRFRSANSEREVMYSPGSTRVDLDNLAKIIARLEYECGLITGMSARRVTIAG